MRRIVTLWGVAAVMLSVAAAGALISPQDEAKKVLPAIEGAKKVSKKISKEAQAKIEKALGEKLNPEDLSPAIYEGKCVVPIISATEKSRVLVCVVTVKGAKGDMRIGVAAVPEEKLVVAVKFLKNDEDKFLESKAFLYQFDGYEYTDHLFNPPDRLADARQRAKDGKDKDLSLIFDLMGSMRAVGVRWEAMVSKVDASDAGAADDAAAQKKAFQDVEKMIPRISFMKSTQIDRFKLQTGNTIREYDRVADGAKNKRFVDARKAINEMDTGCCAKCHSSTQRIFKDKRYELGIGNGYLSVGFDLSAPDDKRDQAQAAAKGIRKALLLMSEAR